MQQQHFHLKGGAKDQTTTEKAQTTCSALSDPCPCPGSQIRQATQSNNQPSGRTADYQRLTRQLIRTFEQVRAGTVV
ncbi:hypothetical protein [Methanolobus profundi]|uniref:hypothetical protein n=1 Tax=Methanolobus profundi TaxID=487685 RepID=UPI001160A7F3|nr:hypothetical protein [Methanolobus profundi]